jgi:hypothetical protein
MWVNALLFSILGVIAFCMVANTFQILSASILPASFIGACLGAIISAIITQFLLSGQTEHEEIKERNVKVFERKSKISHEFIDDLWNVLEKQKITLEEYEQLRKKFSVRLMIYLKEKANRSIANYLKNIGKFVDDTGKTYEDLKENIFGIINILSGEINLGGKLDIEIDKSLEEPIFPRLFKRAILNELNNSLQSIELSEGKFCKEDDLISDGEWGGEYVCFDFRRFKGCKLLIGSFSKYCPHAGIWMLLFIDKSIHSIDKFRYNDEEEFRFCEFSKYLIEIWATGGDEGEWAGLVKPYTDNEKYMALDNFEVPPGDGWLFLDEPFTIEPYRHNYQEVARIIGKRADYWFKNGWIWEKEGDTSIPITDFLEKYLGNKKEN